MTLRESEIGLRRTGNPRDSAAVIKATREARGKDVPLPTTEGLFSIPTFTQENRKKLEKAGLHGIYPLTGQSIKTERDAGRPFRTTWHKVYPAFEVLTSRLTEVAINPNRLFLPGSNRKTLLQQEEMVEAYSQELQRKLDTTGIKAIIGEVADYVELAFTHPTSPNERLFGKRHNFDFARTKTPIKEGGPSVAGVGRFAALGLHVRSWNADRGDVSLWAVPLVVPFS